MTFNRENGVFINYLMTYEEDYKKTNSNLQDKAVITLASHFSTFNTLYIVSHIYLAVLSPVNMLEINFKAF